MNERTRLPGERVRTPGGGGNGARWAMDRGRSPAASGSALPKDPRLDDGERHFQLAHYDRAVEIWEAALAASPANDHLLNRLGDAWARLGKDDSAAAFWERAARVAADQGFFLRAVPILRKVLKLHPKRLDVQERIAEFYARGQRDMEAQEELRALGEAYIQDGQLRRATAIFEKLADGDRGDINSHITLAHLYVEGGRSADAARCFVLLGRWLATHGHLADAPGYFRRAAELMPAEPAMIAGVTSWRAPSCSRYTLKPRLLASKLVCQADNLVTQPQPHVECHLVVSRTGRVQLLAGLADDLHEPRETRRPSEFAVDLVDAVLSAAEQMDLGGRELENLPAEL